jgi:hypothetical protein
MTRDHMPYSSIWFEDPSRNRRGPEPIFFPVPLNKNPFLRYPKTADFRTISSGLDFGPKRDSP